MSTLAGLAGFGAFALFTAVGSLLGLVSFVLWVYLSIQGYSLNHVKLPVAGDIAEQWAAKPM